MDRWLAVSLMAIAGGLVAVQPALNSGLGRTVGVVPAAMISFGIGTLVLGVIVVFTGGPAQVTSTFTVPWYYLLGGVFGALWVVFSIPAVKAIGAGGVFSATIAGQLAAAMVADRLGVFGLEPIGVTPARIAGLAFLIFGTYLIVR